MPTDFSAAAQLATPYSRALAQDFGANLVALHVVTEHLEHLRDEIVSPAVDPRVARLAEQAERTLHALDPGFDPKRTRRDVVCAATAASGILAAIETHGTDLVVMSTHGRGVLGRLLFGSVTAEVAAHAPCPVLCIKSHEHGMLAPDGTLYVERLLVGVDTSRSNDAAFDVGLSLAKKWHAELHIMDITHPQLSPFFFPEGAVTFVEDVESRVTAESQLGRWLGVAKANDVTATLANDDLMNAGRLRGYAIAHDVDCILVERRRRGRLPFTLGGGPENLMHDVRCPLWVL